MTERPRELNVKSDKPYEGGEQLSPPAPEAAVTRKYSAMGPGPAKQCLQLHFCPVLGDVFTQ